MLCSDSVSIYYLTVEITVGIFRSFNLKEKHLVNGLIMADSRRKLWQLANVLCYTIHHKINVHNSVMYIAHKVIFRSHIFGSYCLEGFNF